MEVGWKEEAEEEEDAVLATENFGWEEEDFSFKDAPLLVAGDGFLNVSPDSNTMLRHGLLQKFII